MSIGDDNDYFDSTAAIRREMEFDRVERIKKRASKEKEIGASLTAADVLREIERAELRNMTASPPKSERTYFEGGLFKVSRYQKHRDGYTEMRDKCKKCGSGSFKINTGAGVIYCTKCGLIKEQSDLLKGEPLTGKEVYYSTPDGPKYRKKKRTIATSLHEYYNGMLTIEHWIRLG